MDGDKVIIPSTSTIESVADVVVSVTGTFVDFSQIVTGIPDIDGDGYGDLIVAETDLGTSPDPEDVVVLR